MGVKLFYQLATHPRPAPDPKAFVVSATRNSALVAVSAGLLNQMNEVEAVLAHEIGHVANNDMVTLALIQGVVNTFVIFLSRIIGHIVDRTILGNRLMAQQGEDLAIKIFWHRQLPVAGRFQCGQNALSPSKLCCHLRRFYLGQPQLDLPRYRAQPCLV